MHRCRLALLLAAVCAAPAALAQSSASFATPARDSAAAYVAQNNFVVRRVATECLALVGRSESPDVVVKSWQERNGRYVAASSRYLDRRLDDAQASGGNAQREALLEQIRNAVQGNGESMLRSLLQGRKEESCMQAITLVDTGALDISRKLPQFEDLEALVKWADQ